MIRRDTGEGLMSMTISRRVLILAAGLAGLAWTGLAQAAPADIKVPLSGQQVTPPIQTAGSGTADITYDPATRQVTWSITYSGLSSPATMAHFHGPATPGQNGPVVVWLTQKGTPPGNTITGKATLTPAQAQQFMAGEWYVNVHTQSHPAGEIRGQVIPKS
jgi:hypothetical protein